MAPAGLVIRASRPSWKSFTAHKANSILKRSGDFWFREYFDRFIRDDRHFVNAVGYIEMNPVKAGLAGRAEEWRWSSAWWRGRAEGDGKEKAAGETPADPGKEEAG